MEQSKYLKAYKLQKYRAAERNIDFTFSYEEWLNWWGSDIDKRGRTNNALQMCRYGDTGPYHPDNVYKATKLENQAEMFARLGKQKKTVVKQKRFYVTPFGRFASRAAAARHIGIHQTSLSERQFWNPSVYYYVSYESISYNK